MKKRRILYMVLFLLLLPLPVLAAEFPKDGLYTAAVTLSGGSGRASVQSPATVCITDGTAIATIIWSSPYYEYMLINGVYYDPVNAEGASTFEIPIAFDEDIAITAQTIAMSEPHQIDYILRFDRATLKPVTQKNTWASAIILCAAAAAGIGWRILRRKQQNGGAT